MAHMRAELPLLALLALLSAACVRAACPTQQSQDVFMGLINEQRAVHGSPPLVWNETLAGQAQEWSDACIGEYSDVPPGANYGETLLWALNKDGVEAESGLDVCSYAAAQWYQEVNFYDWAKADSNPNTPNPPSFDPDEATRSFAQVVWGGSTSVGCGVTECASPFGAGPFTLVTCRFHPAGTGFKRNVFRTACQNITGDDGCSSCSSLGACLACYSGLNLYPNPNTGRCRPSSGGDASSGGVRIPTRPSGITAPGGEPAPGAPPTVIPGVPDIPDIPEEPSMGPGPAPSPAPVVAPSMGPDVAPSMGPDMAPESGPGPAPSMGPDMWPAMGPSDPPLVEDFASPPDMAPGPSSPSVAGPPEGSDLSPASPSPSPGSPSAAPGSPSPSPNGGDSPSPSPEPASPSPGGGDSPSPSPEPASPSPGGGDSPSPSPEPASPSPDGGGGGASPSPA